jgi:hypothetical protein
VTVSVGVANLLDGDFSISVAKTGKGKPASCAMRTNAVPGRTSLRWDAFIEAESLNSASSPTIVVNPSHYLPRVVEKVLPIRQVRNTSFQHPFGNSKRRWKARLIIGVV